MTARARRRLLPVTVLLTVVMAALAHEGNSARVTGPVPASAAVDARVPARLLVTAREFAFGLSRVQVRAHGRDPLPVIVQFLDAGEDPHDLRIRRLDARGRPGRVGWRFQPIRPGQLVERELRLRPGRYRLVCTLAGHERRGMRTTLRVRR